MRRLIAVLLALALLAACGPAFPTPVPTVPPLPTQTPAAARPTPTPAPPLGSLENPYGMAFVLDPSDANAQNSAAALADRLTRATGQAFRAQFYDDYPALLDALSEGLAHYAWLPPFTYLSAHNRNLANALLLSNHFGVYQYGAQFLAHANSGLTAYFDPQTNTNTTDAATALSQLNGRRPCWVDAQSASGYVVPLGLLAGQELTLPQGVFLLNHSAVVRAVYVQGICDFGVTYATYGDPRTNNDLLADLPDALEQVPVLWQTDPVIPNLALAVHPAVAPELNFAVRNALVDASRTEAGAAELSTANNYEIAELRPVDDTAYNDLRAALDASGLWLHDLIGH